MKMNSHGDNHGLFPSVQYGAGLCGPKEWFNFDSSPTLRLQRIPLAGRLFQRIGPRFPRTVRYGDIVRGLPLADESCSAVYCSHVLEHLSLEDFRLALRNTRRYLIPGGRFRFVLPDLESLARDYLDCKSDDAAIRFMEDSYLGKRTRRRGVAGLIRSWLGNSSHLWMWDYASISRELTAAGFTNIRRAAFGDLGDPMFALVEDRTRWKKCLGINCHRPEAVAAAA